MVKSGLCDIQEGFNKLAWIWNDPHCTIPCQKVLPNCVWHFNNLGWFAGPSKHNTLFLSLSLTHTHTYTHDHICHLELLALWEYINRHLSDTNVTAHHQCENVSMSSFFSSSSSSSSTPIPQEVQTTLINIERDQYITHDWMWVTWELRVFATRDFVIWTALPKCWNPPSHSFTAKSLVHMDTTNKSIVEINQWALPYSLNKNFLWWGVMTSFWEDKKESLSFKGLLSSRSCFLF